MRTIREIERRRRGEGFTLVELLIVIAIIGILAGSVVLVSGGATDKAEATKIVSNLRTMKSAALIYFADKGSWPTQRSDIVTYMDRDPGGSYDIAGLNDYFVVFGPVPDRLKDKLNGMASEAGLLGGANSTASFDVPYNSHAYVGMKIR